MCRWKIVLSLSSTYNIVFRQFRKIKASPSLYEINSQREILIRERELRPQRSVSQQSKSPSGPRVPSSQVAYFFLFFFFYTNICKISQHIIEYRIHEQFPRNISKRKQQVKRLITASGNRRCSNSVTWKAKWGKCLNSFEPQSFQLHLQFGAWICDFISR